MVSQTNQEDSFYSSHLPASKVSSSTPKTRKDKETTFLPDTEIHEEVDMLPVIDNPILAASNDKKRNDHGTQEASSTYPSEIDDGSSSSGSSIGSSIGSNNSRTKTKTKTKPSNNKGNLKGAFDILTTIEKNVRDEIEPGPKPAEFAVHCSQEDEEKSNNGGSESDDEEEHGSADDDSHSDESHSSEGSENENDGVLLNNTQYRRTSRRAKSASVEKQLQAAARDDDCDEERSEDDEDDETNRPATQESSHGAALGHKSNGGDERRDDEDDDASEDDTGRSEERSKTNRTAEGNTHGEDGSDGGFASSDATKKRKKAPEKSSGTKRKKKSIVETTKAVLEETRGGDGNVDSSRGRAKRKTRPAIKTEASVKKEQGGDGKGKKPKRKGPRVSEAIIKHVAQQMLEVLIKNYKDDIKTVPMDILATSIRSAKGRTYTNPKSDAIVEGLKRLVAEDKAEKSGVTAAALSRSEIGKIPKEQISKDPLKVFQQRREQFLDRLAKNKKGGTGTTVVSAANAVFDKLGDGNAYTRKELVSTTTYAGTNSSGFEAIMKVLSEMNLIENKGGSKSAFTSKVFPHGRP